MEIYQTKNGYLGVIKGVIGDVPFTYQVLDDTAKSVHQQLVFEVAKLCAYARLSA